MGLDMYLDKVRKLDKNVTLEQLRAINEYFGWKERGDKYKWCSMKKWCGVDRSEVNMKLAKKYESEYIHRYASLDTDHKYGFKTIYQEIAYWRNRMGTNNINNNLWKIFTLLNTERESKHGFRIVGDELLCKTKEQAEVIADFFEDLGFDYVRTGYYDPKEDAKENCVDEYTGWYYVDFD